MTLLPQSTKCNSCLQHEHCTVHVGFEQQHIHPVVTSWIFRLLGGLNWEGISVLANASMALALSVHTPRVQLSVYIVSTCWRSELG